MMFIMIPVRQPQRFARSSFPVVHIPSCIRYYGTDSHRCLARAHYSLSLCVENYSPRIVYLCWLELLERRHLYALSSFQRFLDAADPLPSPFSRVSNFMTLLMERDMRRNPIVNLPLADTLTPLYVLSFPYPPPFVSRPSFLLFNSPPDSTPPHSVSTAPISPRDSFITSPVAALLCCPIRGPLLRSTRSLLPPPFPRRRLVPSTIFPPRFGMSPLPVVVFFFYLENLLA